MGCRPTKQTTKRSQIVEGTQQRKPAEQDEFSRGPDLTGVRNDSTTDPKSTESVISTLIPAPTEPPTVPTPIQDSGVGDLQPFDAPAYRIRRSICTSRVKYGESNLIHDKYHLTTKVLGTGVSGAVRVAIDKRTGKHYAIKTLNLADVSAKKAAMLHNEVEIYLKLDHPNIAKLIEVYEDPDKIFLVMELCTGRELYDRLAARKRYSEKDAADVAVQMLEAINYCHKHRICHRDLKLENWVYSSENEGAILKLIDFGFSRIFSPAIPMTAMHGTVYYVSPEVMDGCYREKCDVWSIGVIVYMLLSGSPPFNASGDTKILIKIKTAPVSFEGPIWDSISPQAKDFVAKLLAKDPQDRLSAEGALNHEWLSFAAEADMELDVSILQSMREFALGNIIKRAALGLVAFSLTTEDVADLYKEFKKLDKDRKGTIKLQDLVIALQEKLDMSKSEAKRIFERLDQTGDREVHYSEFLASTLQGRIASSSSWVHDAFDKLDANNNGIIDLEDLRQVLGDAYHGIPVEKILELYDKDSDGAIDFGDFVSAVSLDGENDGESTEEQ